MRILYLIGNGFDIHVGLNTSYSEFLSYYLEQPYPDNLDTLGKISIDSLKEDIKGNIKLWSELELQFGKHMAKLGRNGESSSILRSELNAINDDIRNNLSQYIKKEEAKIFFQKVQRYHF